MKIGIDIGGTKLAAIALDNMGNQLAVKNIPTPKGYKNALNEIIRVTEQLEKEVQLPVKGIGISLAGIVNNNGSIKYAANLPWLIEKPLISDLKKYKHNCPIAIANDANCFTMSEAFDGAAANTKVVFGLTLGTGVGGGIVINGHIYRGINNLSGEWGHIPFPNWNSTKVPRVKCSCGRYGCIETLLSGRALERIYQSLSGNLINVPQIVKNASRNDKNAKSAMHIYHQRLAEALSLVVTLIDPDVIVVGGGLSEINSIYQIVPKKIAEIISIKNLHTRMVRAKHGPSSGMRGATLLIQHP